MDMCQRLADLNPFWIEEPTHPDDVLGHQWLAQAIAPTAIALGEHVPNRVLFNHVALGLDRVFLEYIPHLREYFTEPARVEGGVYDTPREPGASCDLKDDFVFT
jgi:L-alanine-DL-glutamate epimerase-like enolase superfamily enzyme